MNLYIEDNSDIEMKVNQTDEINLRAGDTINLGSSDYNDLTNKPSIEGVELVGNVTLQELGALTEETDPTVPAWAKRPTKPSYKTSEFENDAGFITEDDIPPLVTDLGEIDGDLYEWEIEDYLNTLQETGSYMFLWDEFEYWVDIEALEVDGTTAVQQIYWGSEEGAGTIYYRNLVIDSGEIVRADTTSYLTFDEASSAFARNTHTHVRFDAKSQSIWDYCNTVAMSNTNPFVIYFDLSTNKTYLIETFVGNRQPIYKMQKVTEMNDISYFCQRSSYYYSAREHWGDWEYIGSLKITVNGTSYPITAITKETVSGVSGVLVDYDDGNSGQLFFADGDGLSTVKSAIELTIPHDTSELTNGAGFLTISDLPIYDGGVQ